MYGHSDCPGFSLSSQLSEILSFSNLVTTNGVPPHNRLPVLYRSHHILCPGLGYPLSVSVGCCLPCLSGSFITSVTIFGSKLPPPQVLRVGQIPLTEYIRPLCGLSQVPLYAAIFPICTTSMLIILNQNLRRVFIVSCGDTRRDTRNPIYPIHFFVTLHLTYYHYIHKLTLSVDPYSRWQTKHL